VKARRLLPDGSHERIGPGSGEAKVRAQQALYEQVRAVQVEAKQQQHTHFVPHRPPDAEE
jgi:hypothetical protein